MTIEEYLKNPYGRGSAFSSSKKQQEDLDKQYLEISERIKCSIYRYRDYVIYHVVIPSTKRDNVSYDVVIEIETKYLHEGDANVEKLDFKVFSNCPSFIFTYANVFRNNKLLCEWLLPKYDKNVRTKAPTQRNAYNIIGLERSLYLALKYLHMTKRTDVSVYKTTGKKISGRNEIIRAVRSQAEILSKTGDKIKDKKPDKLEEKDVEKEKRHSNTQSIKKTGKIVKRVPRTKKVKSVKNIKTI